MINQSFYSFLYADIDECGVSDQCDASYGICTNTVPGYTCSCPAGFTLGSDQRSCIGK